LISGEGEGAAIAEPAIRDRTIEWPLSELATAGPNDRYQGAKPPPARTDGEISLLIAMIASIDR